MSNEDLEPSPSGDKSVTDSFELSTPDLDGQGSLGEREKAGDTDPDLTTAEDETEPEVPDNSSHAPADEPAFDLAAELTEVFADDDRRTNSTSGNLDDGFAAVFREFKRGVQRTVSQGDYETHYDLGIAYREMGLLEDAAGEFQLAMESPTRKMDCLHMLGLCAIDLKRPDEAVAHLERALSLPEVPDPQQVALRFDLGRAFEQMGDRDRARTAFETVAALDPEFQDVGDRLANLPADSTATTHDGAATDLPDSLGEADAARSPDEASGAAPTAFESFDDVIADAESEIERGGTSPTTAGPREAEEQDDAEAPAATDGEMPAPTPASTPAPKKDQGPPPPRRRKISFV